jgi:prolyl oligopeptidase
VVIGEDPGGAVLEDFALTQDEVVALSSHHALSQVKAYDRESGAFLRDVDLPGAGTADITGQPDERPDVTIGYTDYATPYRLLGGDHVARGIVSQQVTYRSADGTEVRMSIVATASAPTVLYGYGGFNVALTPSYSSSIRAWVAAGGVWAVAGLRGGSEEGEAWHRAGMREHKQRVFEDFEAAGEWLVAEGWATAGQLGIMGGSNGGLLVGAVTTRRPDLWRAVVCSAPLLDMLRYELFGLGATWSDEFGRVEDPEEAGWLLGYSPYHHVAAGTAYPAVLFTVFDSDTRVDPLHARKMAAALQAATTVDPDERPVLLRAEADVGHGARSVARSVALAADELAFLAAQLGLPFGPSPEPHRSVT